MAHASLTAELGFHGRLLLQQFQLGPHERVVALNVGYREHLHLHPSSCSRGRREEGGGNAEGGRRREEEKEKEEKGI